MKERDSKMKWFPFWTDKWIFGSMRIECTIIERAIWIDLLALASKDNGFIRANEDTPYLITQLAGMLVIKEDQLRNAINKFIRISKLGREKNGVLYIVKWNKYQLSERHKRRIKEEINKEMSGKLAIASAEIGRNKDKDIKKSNIKNNNKPSYPRIKILECDIELTKLLLEKILENNPESRARKMTDKQKEGWQNDCRLMREQDGRVVDEIREVIIWAQDDDFWHTNILSMGKLRKQWDQLILKMGKTTKNKESWAERSERKETEGRK